MQQLQGFLLGLGYLASGLGLLALFVYLYEKFTPYREFQLIAQGNVAAAISLGGAILGLGLPIAIAIHATHNYLDMLLWGSLGCLTQFVIFLMLRRFAKAIEANNIAVAILFASVSIVSGLMCGMSMS